MKPKRTVIPLGLIICLVAGVFAVAQLYYASWLNALYYEKNAPFYDSISYLDQLFRTWEATRDHGLLAGFKKSMSGTTGLPFMLIPPISNFVVPSRTLAIALQSFWVFALYASLAWFFIRHKGAGLIVGLSLPALFVSIAGIYYYNGGISDFRMDLQMYLCFGLAVVWFLIARDSKTAGSWFALGAICGLACLGRATAPVFLVLTLGPMVLVSWLTKRMDFADVCRATAYASVACIGVAGWFYIINWETLYYYYFIWNLDANAHLPLSQSVSHFRYAYASTGAIIIVAGLLLLILRAIAQWQASPLLKSPQAESKTSWFYTIDWAIIFPALVPAGFLMARGAGLNPFVSMPSAFGVVLLMIMLSRPWSFTSSMSAWAAIIIVFGSIGTALGGISSHASPPGSYNQISGYKQAWNIITHNATGHSAEDVKIAQLGLGYFSVQALFNYITFDTKSLREGHFIIEDKVYYKLSGRHTSYGMAASPADWIKVPGVSDDAKRKSIINIFNQQVSFLIVPTDATTIFLETYTRHNFINTQLTSLRDKILLDDSWVQVGPEFSISEQEHYVILMNRDLLRTNTIEDRR